MWTANGAAVYARGDLLVDNEENVFRLDPAAANQTPVAALTAVASGDVTGVVLRAP